MAERSALVAILAALTAAPGCVLGVEDRFVVQEEVDRIVLTLDSGSAHVEAGPRGSIEVDAELGGIGGADFGHSVVDRVLYLDYQCGNVDLCAGDVFVTAPPLVALEVVIGAGELVVDGMAGDVTADLGTGEVRGRELTSRVVDVVTGAGAIDVELLARPLTIDLVTGAGAIDLTVPAGAYALALDAVAGAIEVDGVEDDPEADASITATAKAGSITLTGR